MEAKNIVVKADVRQNPGKNRIGVLVIFLLLLAASLIVGLIHGTTDSTLTQEHCTVGWFNFPFVSWRYSHVYSEYMSESSWFFDNIALVALLYLVAAVTPFLVKALYKRMCKNTELIVTGEQLLCSYSNVIVIKKTLQIPIEKVDNLVVISTVFDKLRTGKTLGVCSASGMIRLHFIQNADEVVSLTMERINEIKNKEKQERTVPQPSATIPASMSIADKLRELASLKEAGLISEEEYENKRNDLLAKM